MHTNLVYGIAILLLILGVFGFMDISNNTYLGYANNDFKVTRVEDGSPADAAGMQVGDQLKTINGLDVRDASSWDAMPRAKVGETREFVIDRNGEELTMELTYAAQSGTDSMISKVGWFVGLIYLLMGLWAYRSKTNWSSFLFALFALAFATAFLGRPYIADPAIRDVVNSIFTSFFLFGFALLFVFLMHFPEKSKFMEKKNASLMLFAPAIIMSVIIIGLNIFEPKSTSSLNTTVDMLFLLFIVFYFGGSVVLLVRRYLAADAATRSSSGLSMLFWGSIVGLLPILIYIIIGNISPTTVLPGEDYVFLSLGLVPICFALAIKNSGAAATD